jgi:tetratricopeptide (TPR) repeat protein
LAERVIASLIESGKANIAVPVIDTAVAKNPGDPALVRLQWQIYRAAKLFARAATIGEEMIRTDTAAADTTFWHQLVAAYVADSQPQKAQEAASRGAAKFSNVPSLWFSVAQLARQNGQAPQALEAINRVVALDARYPGAYLQKAAIYSEMNQTDSLVATLRVAVQNGADSTTAGAMILPKANALFREYQSDSAATVERGEYILGMLAYADSLSPTETTKFLTGVTQLLLGRTLLTRSSEAKSCDDAWRANDLLISAQQLIQQGGKAFPGPAGSAMQGAMQLQPYADRNIKALCK